MVFVGLLSSLNVYFRAFSLAIFYLAIVMLVFLFCSAFHKAPLILNAYIWRWVLGGGRGEDHAPSGTQCFLWLCSG